jgi:cystathionine beta-lyase
VINRPDHPAAEPPARKSGSSRAARTPTPFDDPTCRQGTTSPFDDLIARDGTGALALAGERYGLPADLTPMWIADSAFQTPRVIRQALKERAEHGIIGYSLPTETYFQALEGFFARRHNWYPAVHQAVITRGVVHAIYLAVESLTRQGDGVLIQVPVYQPFFEVIEHNRRQLLTNPLVQTADGWQIDFDDFEEKAHLAKLFILCSPHNPVGRVWTRPELEKMAEICLRHGVKIISDEIHHDLVYPRALHTVTAALAAEVGAITVTCTAPSKTFNLAGLQLANSFADDRSIRQRLTAAYSRQGLSQHPALGLLACQTAYSGAADSWLDAQVAYLDANLDWIEQFLAQRLPQVGYRHPEGTYLAWLDFRQLGLTADELDRAIIDRARLWLSDGASFGRQGSGFKRLNAAAPRAVIADALERLAAALGA